PPGSQIGPITAEKRQALLAGSLVAGVYEKAVDRESAYEKIKGRAAQVPEASPARGAPRSMQEEAADALRGGASEAARG
ncbi:DUF853 family protein, partial [Klebsiella pneumoniae]|nr:DUF853 family protein [Klebsiella pneumoniae]